MGRNPDNPEKCSYLMMDGVSCLEKTISATYDNNLADDNLKLVPCPFVKPMEEVRLLENRNKKG